jgi:hypothetical protein
MNKGVPDEFFIAIDHTAFESWMNEVLKRVLRVNND